VQYPGRRRVDDLRGRLASLRRDVDLALDREEALRADIDGLRAEVASLSTTIGTQIAALMEAVERLERELADRADPGGDRAGPSSGAR